MRTEQAFEAARRVAERNREVSISVSAVLFDRSGKVVAIGRNKRLAGRGRLGQHTIHAEVDVVSRVRKPSSNLTLVLYRRGAKVITPCSGCSKVLRSYGVSVCFHTTGSGVARMDV